MQISACFITKNEEKNIGRAIRSLQGMYDELVVVDTGSTDNTVAIAEKYGAKVYCFAWQNDFSMARNYAIDKVHGDWLIFLDADEYYDGQISLREYLNCLEEQYPMREAVMISLYEAHMMDNPPTHVVKIFRRRPDIRYKGAIHEVINKEQGKLRIILADELKFIHTGYHPDNMEYKSKRNLQLLLNDIEKNGENEAYYYYIAECYFCLREYAKAIEYIKKAIASPVRHYGEEANYYHIYLESMRQCNYPGGKMVPVAAEAIKKFPDMPEFYGEQGIILSSMGNLDEAFAMLNKCVEKYEFTDRQNQEYGYFNADIMGIIYARLARIAFVQEKKDFSRIAACLAVQSSQGKWGGEEKEMLKADANIDHQVIVCVPIYKNTLSAFERASLRQLNKILGKYQRVFVAPQSLDFDFGDEGESFRVERFPDYFFQNVRSYSALMLNVDFYRRFSNYEYLLIYQTDAFVFSDRLQEFCRLGYDYIGAPIERANPLWNFIGNRVGNGGLSLRKVSSAIRILENWDRLVGNSPLASIFWPWEDIFWGYCGRQADWNFKIPPTNIAVEFAVQDNVCRAYKKLEAGWRPFGCHGWWQTKEGYEVWQPIIEGCGFDFSGEKDLAKSKYSRCQNYCQNHGKLNTHYLWGLYRKGHYNRFLTVLDNWLEKFPADFDGWQIAMEDIVCLWRSLEAEQHDKTWHTACQLRLAEAINRSLYHGVKYPVWWNLITMVPWLQKYDYPSMQALASNICSKWWDVWSPKTDYQQAPRIMERTRRVVVLTEVMDDAAIIESFVRHTLTFADAILVDIRLAASRTLAIVKSLEQEGLPLILHEKKLSPAQVRDGDDIVLELAPYDFLLPQTADINVRMVLEDMTLSENIVVENWQYAICMPFAYRDKFVLARPLVRQLTSQKYRLLSDVNEEKKTQIAAALYLATVKDIYGDELAIGVIPADMEVADISNFAMNHELRYTK